METISTNKTILILVTIPEKRVVHITFMVTKLILNTEFFKYSKEYQK